MQTSLLTMKLRLWYLMLVFFRCCAIFIYRRRAHKNKRCNSIRILSSRNRMSLFENVKLIVSRQMKLFPSILPNPTTPHQIEFESYAVTFVSFFLLFFHVYFIFIVILFLCYCFFLSFISFYVFNKCCKQVVFIEIDRLLVVRTRCFQFIFLFLHLFAPVCLYTF